MYKNEALMAARSLFQGPQVGWLVDYHPFIGRLINMLLGYGNDLLHEEAYFVVGD